MSHSLEHCYTEKAVHPFKQENGNSGFRKGILCTQINVHPTSMSVYKTGNFVKNIWPNVVNYTPPPLSLTIKVLEGTVKVC